MVKWKYLEYQVETNGKTMILITFDVDGTLDCKENDNESYLKGVVPDRGTTIRFTL